MAKRLPKRVGSFLRRPTIYRSHERVHTYYTVYIGEDRKRHTLMVRLLTNVSGTKLTKVESSPFTKPETVMIGKGTWDEMWVLAQEFMNEWTRKNKLRRLLREEEG